MKKYDVIVIGSGGGAKIVSPTAKLGLKVAVLEKDALGGTCLNRGCIPSKMLIHPADVALQIREAHKFNIDVDPAFTVDFTSLIRRISNTVDEDSHKISVGYGKNPNIDFYHCEGKFAADKVIAVDGQEITADKIFIAVGARPQIPDIPGLAGTPFMTSTEALRNTTLPKKLIVLGGGYIAVELGHAYGALGTEVHFIVRSKLLRQEDNQVSEEFSKVFSKHHSIHFGFKVVNVEYRNNRFTLTCRNPSGQEEKISSDALLAATGVVPNTDSLGLKNTEVQLDERGFVKVNEYLETNVAGIYSLGDCLGRYLYRHSVNFEGEYLMRTVFVQKSRESIRYPPMPHAIFTHPQVAGVGKTEEELKKEGVDYVVGLNSYAQSAMGMALRSDHGFVKILIERKTRRILGAHIVGAEASNMIHMLIA
ncbi:MAG TPA: dihydrolipoyl dehydrogenase, partial [Candidatus Omnitrophota bacterium]|nr:dihydrolipoyl dehydrogenase [Candidatus Omnitrophota bacterium]